MERRTTELFLSRLPAVNALVVGDLMLDEYLWGTTDRISPEAPVPVVDVRREDLRLGGAGNVVNNLLALGCRVQVAGVLGDDREGRQMSAMLEAAGVTGEGIVFEPGRITSRKTRIAASNQQMLRIDREHRRPIGPETERSLLAFLRATMAGHSVVLVSDYLKGTLTEGLLKEIVTLGRACRIPVVIDPKGHDFGKYRGATLLTPNRKEAQTAARIPIIDEKSLLAAGRHLCQDLDLDALVLTRSEEGMTVFRRQGTEMHLPTKAREVYDVTGAGDTVLAVLGSGLAAGLDLEEAARMANLAAGVVVGKVGTSALTPVEILEASGRQQQDTDFKIRGREILRGILEREREHGRVVVFTNGCFDLLHAGHVKYLQKARRLGDLLVLGLNSDASIRRLKGPRRPLIDQEARAHILAALDCIDFVVVFEEDTPLELIRLLHPDILVKGGDYTPDTVVGRELVESYGGRVEIVKLVAGRSTTGIIENILEKYQET